MVVMFRIFIVSVGLYEFALVSSTTGYTHTVTRVGDDVNITMNPANVSFPYHAWVNGSVAERLLLVVPRLQPVTVLNSSHTGYTTRVRYIGEDSLSQTGQLRFTIYNVTVQDAGTYYCRGINGENISGCRQVLVVTQKPATPTITGPASPVSGENVTLTCSSSSRSLPPDHPPLTMTYIWRRDRTRVESGDESPTGGDDLTITHISRENHGDIYSCQAVEEGLESDWSHGHVLDVLYGPDQIQFDAMSETLRVEEGKSATVRCSADCNPACTVTWWNTSRQMVITGHREAVLSIPAVDISVSGLYTCHVNNSDVSASRNLTLDIQHGLHPRPSTVFVAVPVAVVSSVLIIITTAVAVMCVCKRVKKGDRQHRSGARNMEDNESHIQLQPRQRHSAGVVVNIRELETYGSYEEIDVPLANVDDIVPVVAAYSIILTAVSVVVAAVAVLVCQDARHGHNGSNCGTYLTVVGDRLSSDANESPYAAINNEDMLPLHDYERLLREQFQIYTSHHPSASSTQDPSTRCSLM